MSYYDSPMSDSSEHLAGQYCPQANITTIGPATNDYYCINPTIQHYGQSPMNYFEPRTAQAGFEEPKFGHPTNTSLTPVQQPGVGYSYVQYTPPPSPESLTSLHTTHSSMGKPKYFVDRATGAKPLKLVPLRQKPTHKRSRDESTTVRPPSLAATHPANYNSQPKSMMPPPPLPPSLFSKQMAYLATPPPSTNTSPLTERLPTPDTLTPSSPTAASELGGHVYYADPMHQSSTEIVEWGTAALRPFKADTSLEHGNVISPTFMIGLPFGGTVEMAVHYPSWEEAEKRRCG